MNPYNVPSPPRPRPRWKSTPVALGLLLLVALTGALNLYLGFLAMVAAMVAMWTVPPWRWFAKLGATFGAFLLLTIGAGIGGQVDDGNTDKANAKAPAAADERPALTSSPAVSVSPRIADYTGKSLAEAEKWARPAGFTTARHDASTENRTIHISAGWSVCFQDADTAGMTIDFAAAKSGEPCPKEDGGPLAWPLMPDVVGATYTSAAKSLTHSGISLSRVTLDDVYLDVDAPTAEKAAKNGNEWHVCFQSPDDKKQVDSTTKVRLDLGRWTDDSSVRSCPESKDTTYEDPTNAPDSHEDEGGNGSTSGGDGNSSGAAQSGRSGGSGSPSGGNSSSDGSSGGSSSGGSSSGGGTSGGSAGTVHPGAFCSPPATGVTKAGTPMVCGPAADGRNRWHHA